nr:RNA-directed DNA polymerase, eukaryota [Tanacetum cinerariifolium]
MLGQVPKNVLQSLESIRSHFFNGHDIISRKASWVKWSNVFTAKDKGGLGVDSLYALNRGLTLKWVWRVLKDQGVNFFDHMRLKLGDGVSTSFWEDKWNARGLLKDLFPRVYALEKCKKASVCTRLMDLESSLRRSIRGGVEQSQFNDLSEFIGDIILTSQTDRYVWSLGSLGDYSVASMRKVIDDNRSPNVFTSTRWVKCMPIKVNVFAWKVKMDALPTRFNISRRGMDIDSILCPICENGAESSSHLFFKCNLVSQISHKITRWWDVPYVEVSSYVEWLNWMVSLRLTAKSKEMLEGSDVKPRLVGTNG